VYSLLVREALAKTGNRSAKVLHRASIDLVCAPAQSRVYRQLEPLLTPEERTILRRGRNAHVSAPPQGATRVQYQEATGVECLFGWLFLTAQTQRAREIFQLTIDNEQ
jgi:ribonuclease-3 family protein